MTITIKIATDNAAFDHVDTNTEVARILRRVADRIEDNGADYYSLGSKMQDINGNTVGSVKVTGK